MGLLVEADELVVVSVEDSAASTGTGVGLGDSLGDTFDTGLDNLDPPEVLATVFGPPADLAGLDALELDAESGDSLLIPFPERLEFRL